MSLAAGRSPSETSTREVATDQSLADRAVALARSLLTTSEREITPGERRRRARLGRLIDDEDGRSLVFALTDEVLRISDPGRAAARFAAIVSAHGTTPALGPIDRVLLRAGALLAPRLSRLVMPLVTHRIAAETHGVVLPADDPAFARHVQRRANEGVRLNINPLGEAILSDAEACARLDDLLARIARADVDYVSVKISSVVANLTPFAFDDSVERIVERLRVIYRAAEQATPRTFVNLDMEEYRDLELSLVSFMRVLDEPAFAGIDAGIVLQAYLPDSHAALDRLGTWARERHARAGGRVKVRIVKGANLAMERVEAELHGWVAAPYPTKADSDASFKAMLDRALRPEWADALRIGVASHNLFDVAWATVVAQHADALDRVEFEMLEGMAPAQARAVRDRVGSLLMYAPVVHRNEFEASIAYLSRRLDENTQSDNFLRALFHLEPDTPEWVRQERRFRAAVGARHAVSTRRRRGPQVATDRFRNEPDSDLTDPVVRTAILAAAVPEPDLQSLRTEDAIDDVVRRANDAFAAWRALPSTSRRSMLRDAAALMRTRRAESIAIMAVETGKVVGEADPEVSEAIDFAEYYAGPGIDLLDELAADGVSVGGRGVVAVIGPWNFPYAIPAGGVFAALAAGNAVILKPAPEAVRVGAVLIDQLHEAGLPRDLVQLVVCEDGPVGRHLVTHTDVDTVMLTGSLATAQMFLGWKPDLRLFAETSGKNALVITATADLDLALADLVRSAFGHAGQKCSAASLAIVEADLYDDPGFRKRLLDIVESWRVGWPDDPASMIGPLIQSPSGPLDRALTRLDPGEEWLVRPEPLDATGRLWRPGVRLGVQPGSWFHRTECFGPVLGIVRADDLDQAIAIQNDSVFGLTGGIHALDPDEIDTWLARVEVGNAYVNRHITGAVVRRQPFGGWKRSSVGPGAKAGGPSHLLQFARLREPDVADLAVANASYERWWTTFYAVDHDVTRLAGEANVLRHRPVERMVVRRAPGDDRAIELLRCAARVTGVPLAELNAGMSDHEVVAHLGSRDRLRVVGPVNDELLRACAERSIWVDRSEPSAHGRIELGRWVREQAISRTLHRHGRLPDQLT